MRFGSALSVKRSAFCVRRSALCVLRLSALSILLYALPFWQQGLSHLTQQSAQILRHFSFERNRLSLCIGK